MQIKQYDIWLANLNPSRGTEAGKIRPVVVIQTDLLNDIHASTLICPVTTNLNPDATLLRIALKKGQLDKPSEILVDQIRAIDNTKLLKHVGRLTTEQKIQLKNNLRIVLDI